MIFRLLPPPLFSHWLLSMPCQTKHWRNLLAHPPGFSLNVFPDAFKNGPRQTTDFSSQCFFLSVEVTALCKALFPGRQWQRRALLSALLTPTPQAPSGFVWGLVPPYSTPCTPDISVLQVTRAWNCNSAQLEILSRILLIAHCLENASSFPSEHILHFPYTEQTCLVSTSLFSPCFDYFPNFSQ